MDTETAITLGIAALGVVLGAASLGWQAATYFLTGGRIKTTLKVGALSGAALVSLPANKVTPDALQQMASQAGRPVIAVEVRNVGRLPVTVARWSIKSSLGISFVPMADSIGPALEHRLDIGESATWAVDLMNAFTLAESSLEVLGKGEKWTRITGVVELADGRTYETPEAFTTGSG